MSFAVDQRVIVDKVAEQAVKAVERVISQVQGLPAAQQKEILLETLPGLVDQYAAGSSSAVAAMLEDGFQVHDQRAIQAVIMDSFERDAARSTGLISQDLFDPQKRDKAWDLYRKMADRIVRQSAAETVLQTSEKYRIRWMRVMRGAETCGWCKALSARGFVYGSAEKAGGNGNHRTWGHDGCDCVAVPQKGISKADLAEYEAEAERLDAEYQEAMRRLEAEQAALPINERDRITSKNMVNRWNRVMAKPASDFE